MDNSAVFFSLLGVAVLVIVCFLLVGAIYIEKKYRSIEKEAPKLRAVPPNVVAPMPNQSMTAIMSLSDNRPLSMGDRKLIVEPRFPNRPQHTSYSHA